MSTIYEVDVTTIEGQTQALSDYRGKALLIVNVASKCGLTPQYEQLEALYAKHKSDGLEVLGFPCNQFAGQEPGSEEEIQDFCRSTFGVQFPMFSKIEVNGESRHPLYRQLVSAQPDAIEAEDGKLKALLKEKGLLSGAPDDILWNFEKFLVNGQGKVVARFAPDVTVDNERFQQKLSKVLEDV
ncbi:MAG: redoxin domain-containing protein [Idiomarina sp.]|nr:redoxin domain-containing protein [Idiomarina sp.]